MNPLVIILLIAAGISGFIGQMLDAGIIVGMVLTGAGINFFQTYRSKIAIENLRARVAPTATVLRDGRWQEIDRKTTGPWRYHPALCGRSGSRRFASSGISRSLCSASRAHRRIASRGEGSKWR